MENEKPNAINITPTGRNIVVTININIQETGEGWVCDSLSKAIDHFPTKQDVVRIVNDYINAKTDAKILSGFVWRDKPVYLSSENQFNFKCAYDLAHQTNGATLPARYKLGEDENGTPVYHTFENLEMFQDFYLGCVQWIQKCINDGWDEKDSIDYDKIIGKSGIKDEDEV
ncbi:MAG: hypothetical protein II604_03875 [Bacteroidales bacterium]|nr:hypothetical protein [Bacteroidales bacterium]